MLAIWQRPTFRVMMLMRPKGDTMNVESLTIYNPGEGTNRRVEQTFRRHNSPDTPRINTSRRHPVLLSPQQKQELSDVPRLATLRWEPVEWAKHYELQVREYDESAKAWSDPQTIKVESDMTEYLLKAAAPKTVGWRVIAREVSKSSAREGEIPSPEWHTFRFVR